MKIRSKVTLYLLLFSLLPLMVTMAISLDQTIKQTRDLTYKTAKATLDTSAATLSSYFSSRVSEIQAYVTSPLIKSMNWTPMRDYLRKELERHAGIYEKFIVSDPSSYFRNTSVGNPYQDYYASFDDADPKAKLKSIRKRRYWLELVGTNQNHEFRTHVSNPMISYTTGVKQVVVGASILDKNEKLVGMLGGAISWNEINSRINQLKKDLLQTFSQSISLSLIDSDGIYIYHKNPEKVVHLKMDKNGKPVFNELGEKTVILTNILDEKTPEIVKAGNDLLNKNKGITFYTNEYGLDETMLYSPVGSTGYGLILTIPNDVILEPVNSLKKWFIFVLSITAIIIIIIAFAASKSLVRRLIDLNSLSLAIADGNYKANINISGKDELGELAQSLVTMRNTLEDRESKLIDQREYAEQANQHKSKFIANMSHELRTPMHAILNFTQLAKKRVKDDKTFRFLDNVETSCKRLTGLINTLLDLSKIESGKMEVSFSRDNLYEVTKKCIAEIDSLLREKNISIKLDSDKEVFAEFDANLISQVIINLLSNAIKYSPEGESIVIKLTNVEAIAESNFNGIVEFVVTDHGIGIPVDELDKVFDKFTQSSKTDTTAGGTGLGLPICREVIKIHYGAIWLQSPVHGDGNGTSAHFIIPKIQSENISES